MGKELDFLRMLEPLVRPGNLPAPSGSKGSEPVESQSFESLLEQAKSGTSTSVSQSVTSTTASDTNTRCDAGLSALSGIDKVENSTLRELIASRMNAGSCNT